MFDRVLAFVKIAASEVSKNTKVTLFNVVGFGPDDDPDDAFAEAGISQEVFQSLGIVGRPLPPKGDLFTEALAARTSDGLVPFAFRDSRIHQALNPGGGNSVPKHGQ